MSNDIDPHITEKYEIKRRLGKGVSVLYIYIMLNFITLNEDVNVPCVFGTLILITSKPVSVKS